MQINGNYSYGQRNLYNKSNSTSNIDYQKNIMLKREDDTLNVESLNNKKGLEDTIKNLTDEQREYLNEKYDLKELSIYNSDSAALMDDLYKMNLISKDEYELYNKPYNTRMVRLPIYLGEQPMSSQPQSMGWLTKGENGPDEYEGLNLWQTFKLKGIWGGNNQEELSSEENEYNDRLTKANSRLAELLEQIFGAQEGYTGGDYKEMQEYKDYIASLKDTISNVALGQYQREQQYKNSLNIN